MVVAFICFMDPARNCFSSFGYSREHMTKEKQIIVASLNVRLKKLGGGTHIPGLSLAPYNRFCSRVYLHIAYAMSQASGAGEGRKRKRALREELRNFYLQQQTEGTNAAPTAATTSQKAQPAAGPQPSQSSQAGFMDLDSASFKPKVYMKHILKTQTLPELLRSDAELIKGSTACFVFLLPQRASYLDSSLVLDTHLLRRHRYQTPR